MTRKKTRRRKKRSSKRRKKKTRRHRRRHRRRRHRRRRRVQRGGVSMKDVASDIKTSMNLAKLLWRKATPHIKNK